MQKENSSATLLDNDNAKTYLDDDFAKTYLDDDFAKTYLDNDFIRTYWDNDFAKAYLYSDFASFFTNVTGKTNSTGFPFDRDVCDYDFDIAEWFNSTGFPFDRYVCDYDFDIAEWFMLMDFKLFAVYALPVLVCLSFVGNTMVLMVVLQNKNRNYSTSVYIASLALADMFINCGFDLNNWLMINNFVRETYSNLDCKLRLVIPTAGSFASVWSLVALGTERAISVLYPHKVKVICTAVSAKTIVSVLWTLSLVLSIFMNAINFYYEDPTVTEISGCVMYIELTEFYRKYFYIFYICIIFFVPYLLILSSTIVILVVLMTTRVNRISGKNMRTSVTFTLLQVNALFLVTVGPRCVFLMLDAIDLFGFEGIEDFFKQATIRALFSEITVFIVDTNSVLNVFVYFFHGSKFRKDLIRFFRRPRFIFHSKQTVTYSSRQVDSWHAVAQH